jgi:hypothetical protein
MTDGFEENSQRTDGARVRFVIATGLATLAVIGALVGLSLAGSAQPGGQLRASLHGRSATPPDGPLRRSGAGASVVAGHASWIRAQTTERLIAKSDAVVVARVTAVRAGPTMYPTGRGKIVVPAGRELPGIPTRRIDVEVTRTLRGSAPDRVTLFQTGGEHRGATLSLEGDPPFMVGATYLLFAERRPDGLYLYQGPDGRYRVLSGGQLDAAGTDGVAKQLDSKTLTDVSALLK